MRQLQIQQTKEVSSTMVLEWFKAPKYEESKS